MEPNRHTQNQLSQIGLGAVRAPPRVPPLRDQGSSERAAARDSSTFDERPSGADLRKTEGTSQTRPDAKWSTMVVASELHLPPVSTPTTTKWHRFPWITSAHLVSVHTSPVQTSTIHMRGLWSGKTSRCEQRAQCDVHRQLRPLVDGQFRGQDFDGPFIIRPDLDVHVSELGVYSDRGLQLRGTLWPMSVPLALLLCATSQSVDRPRDASPRDLNGLRIRTPRQ